MGRLFDHVPPPRVVAPINVDPNLVNGNALLGFHIPPLVVSPFSKGTPESPRVMDQMFDHTSILKLIEGRFGWARLTARDASDPIGNLKIALMLLQPDASIPSLSSPCPMFRSRVRKGMSFGDTFGSEESTDMQWLQQVAASYGWRV